MKLIVDFDGDRVVCTNLQGEQEYSLDSHEAFELISHAWLRCGWDNKYVYSFTWLGRPIIQLPEDLLRLQEVIFSVQPDVIVETGIAHGGGMAFYASLCKALGRGRVIGVDIEIRPHNRRALEMHDLFPWMTLIEGSSISDSVVNQVKRGIHPNERVLVCLDSSHQKAHVLSELEAYSPLVSVGSYIVVMDGIMQDVVGAPRTMPDWSWNNPQQAASEFIQTHSNFVIEDPVFLFNEGNVQKRVTYWSCGFIKRLR